MEPIKFSDFILGAYIDTDVCDALIEMFESSNNKVVGRLGIDNYEPSKKDSTDLCMDSREQNPVLQAYLGELKKVCDLYLQEFKYAHELHSAWQINEPCNIQRYLPGQGFKIWHAERTSPINLNPMRHLVYMTYLNDVDDGGTEWYYQNLKLDAKKGLTVIWPPDWTHTHRGVVSETQTKYIMTGWYSYTLKDYDYDTLLG